MDSNNAYHLNAEEIDTLLALSEKMKAMPMWDHEITINGADFQIHWDTRENWFVGKRMFKNWAHTRHFYSSTFGHLLKNIEIMINEYRTI